MKIPSGFNPAIRPEAFEEEGFVIKTAGNSLVIGGNSDGPYQGTIYGAYEFLERLGCRWYFPGAWGEVVPEKKTITFPETDLVSKPDFVLREQNLGGWFPSTPAERDGLRGLEQQDQVHARRNLYPPVGDGFLGYLLPPKEFMAGDPAVYAMDQSGSRKQPENFNNGVMLSLVNPKTFDLSVQNLRAALAGSTTSAIARIISPKRNGFGISPPDGICYDYDPEAVTKNQNFNYPAYIEHPMTSEEFFGFAAHLANVFPDKWVATMAYAGREMPPQGCKDPAEHGGMMRRSPVACCTRATTRLAGGGPRPSASCASGASSRRTFTSMTTTPACCWAASCPSATWQTLPSTPGFTRT